MMSCHGLGTLIAELSAETEPCFFFVPNPFVTRCDYLRPPGRPCNLAVAMNICTIIHPMWQFYMLKRCIQLWTDS